MILQNTGKDRWTDQSQSSRAVHPSPSARRYYRTPVQIVGQTNQRAQELSTRLHLQVDNTEHQYRSSDRPITEFKSSPPSPSVRRYYRTPVQIVGQTNQRAQELSTRLLLQDDNLEHGTDRRTDHAITEVKICPPVSMYKMIIQNTGTRSIVGLTNHSG
jgi:hypothetical protein